MPQTAARHRLLVTVLIVLAIGAGGLMAGQSLVNGRLGKALDDGVIGALVSFGSGLVLVALINALAPAHRAAVRTLVGAVRARAFPRWYLVAGVMGSIMVFSQAATVSIVGVARFTVAVVVGQVVSGLFVDRIGFAGVPPRRLEWTRIVGAVLMVVAAVLSVSSGLSSDESVATQVLPLLLPIFAGCLTSVQMACNGAIARAAGSVWPSTLVNFAAGTTALTIGWLATRPAHGGFRMPDFPPQWWLYLGGTMGLVLIAVQARIVSTLGALVMGLSTISGQLVGGLVLALVIPSAGPATALTVAGTVLAVAAVALGAVRRKEPSRPSGAVAAPRS